MAVDEAELNFPRKRTKKYAWVALLALLAVSIVFTLGWAAARTFESPTQRAAHAKPPAAGPIYEKVVTGELSEQVGGPALVTYSQTATISPNLSGTAVVTSQPTAKRAVVRSGDAIISLNGRPVLVFAGQFDFYRSLRIGDEGPDVVQLQKGLMSAGQRVTGALGTFGPSTETALQTVYRRDGFRPAHGLPLSEVATAKHLPASLSSLIGVGAHVTDGPVAALGWGERVAKVTLSASNIVRVRLGARAQFISGSANKPINAVVTNVQTSNGQTSATLSVPNGFSSRTLGRAGVGVITLSIVSRSALLVPSRAVAISSDGVSRILVRAPGNRALPISVRVLGSLAGRSAIAPLKVGSLRSGESVKVG